MNTERTKWNLILSRMDWVKANLLTMTNRELAAVLGVSARYLVLALAANGIKRPADEVRRMLDERTRKRWDEEHRLRDSADPAERAEYGRRVKARSDRHKEIYRAEHRRALFGLPAKTRLRISGESPALWQQRHKLKKNGYIMEKGSRTAYYTETTRRCPVIERRARFFRFLPYGTEERRRAPERVYVREAYDGNINFNI